MSEPTQREAVQERWSLVAAAGGFVLGSAASLAVLRGPSPLFGRTSIGEVAALAGSVIAAAAFAVVLMSLRSEVVPWHSSLPRLRRVLDLVGLTLLHLGLTLLALAGAYSIFDQAFQQLALDRWASAFVVGLTCAAAGYAAAGSAASLTTSSLSVAVAAFLGLGAMASAIGSSNPLWWRQHFSALGGEGDPAGWTFNVTLLLTGLVVVSLADFLTHDLTRWARERAVASWRVDAVRIAFIVLGVMLALVGAVPYTLNFTVHNTLAYAMVAVFSAVVAAIPLLFPTLSRPFTVVTLVMVGLIGVAVVLHVFVKYLNTTGFEMIAVTLVFGWLVLLIRTISAAAVDADQRRELSAGGPAQVRRAPGR